MVLNYLDFLNEKEGTFKFGCVMAYFDCLEWNSILNKIDDNDLAEDGKEFDSHVTLLYGLHNNINHQQVIDTVKSFTNISVTLENISLFENEKYDVIKFDVHNPLLNYFNQILKKFPNTNDYPDYHAHATIAYVKSGLGKKYIGKIKPIHVVSNYYIYSLANGQKIKIEI